MITTLIVIGQWVLGIIGSTIANIITFLFFSSVTGTCWFRRLMVKLTKDFNFVKMQIEKEKK
jgi:hypothetical protein